MKWMMLFLMGWMAFGAAQAAERKIVRSAGHVYRIEIGEMDENGAPLTVFVARRDGHWRRVFHQDTALFAHAIPMAYGIALIIKPGTSEAWATRDAQSYDPYAVWRVGPGGARYDLSQSRRYTEAYCCAWAGPKYDEHYGAIGPTTGKGRCKVVTRAQFEARGSR